MYLPSSGFTNLHLSFADRAIPLFGPGDNLPSSSPTSSASAARGVYGKADKGGGGLINSSYVPGAVESKKAEAFGRRREYVSGITEGKIYRRFNQYL